MYGTGCSFYRAHDSKGLDWAIFCSGGMASLSSTTNNMTNGDVHFLFMHHSTHKALLYAFSLVVTITIWAIEIYDKFPKTKAGGRSHRNWTVQDPTFAA